MKRKPKFQIGQVVFILAEKSYMKIASRYFQGHWFYWRGDSCSVGFSEKDLRPLTKRERGAQP
jgi:hypothetical protein